MQIGSWIAVYVVIWWTCLFAILPVGERSQHEAGSVQRGSDPGAPALLRLWPKLLLTSVVSLAVMGLLLWALSNQTLQEYWR